MEARIRSLPYWDIFGHRLVELDAVLEAVNLPPSTTENWFRARWKTGRVGKWHSGSQPIKNGFMCSCGTTSRPTAGWKDKVVEWASERPPVEEMCSKTRVWLEP